MPPAILSKMLERAFAVLLTAPLQTFLIKILHILRLNKGKNQMRLLKILQFT